MDLDPELFRPPTSAEQIPMEGLLERIKKGLLAMVERIKEYFSEEPTFWNVVSAFTVLVVLLYIRRPNTNYIFDEQEALLANPYVNATQKLGFWDAIHRDFWGLPANASVGSYRPLPDFLWRVAWQISKQPFFHHLYNLLLHAVNGALLTVFAWRLTKRRDVAWLSGLAFVTSAVLTEAVSGIVGIADVLGGLGAVGALAALTLRGWAMAPVVALSVAFALFSKESGIVLVPLIPFAALLTAPLLHPDRPARWQRAFLAGLGSVLAFYVYVELRKRWFPSPLPDEVLHPKLDVVAAALGDGARVDVTLSSRGYWKREFLEWFHQAPLPKDRLNNPLVDATDEFRKAGAYRVYFRGLVQVFFPTSLSPDYSAPQEPIPAKLWEPHSTLGRAFFYGPLVGAVLLWGLALWRELREGKRVPKLEPSILRHVGRAIGYGALLVPAWYVFKADWAAFDRALAHPRWLSVGGMLFLALTVGFGLALDAGRREDPIADGPPWRIASLVGVAFGMVWCVVSFYPHSNLEVVLPTVRAERFWYFPAIGTSLIVGIAFAALRDAARRFDDARAGQPLFDLGAAVRLPVLSRVVQPAGRVLAGATGLVVAFFLFQSVQAYRHAMDFKSDLAFWSAARKAVPNSAKAHLNYSVMVGAHTSDLEERLRASIKAKELSPSWTMAHIYTGDTLCRMHRPDDAWEHYAKGFEIGPNEQTLVALALQCLWDEGAIKRYEKQIREIGLKNEGTWIAFLGPDTLDNGETYTPKGVNPKYRPRSYNEGPKE